MKTSEFTDKEVTELSGDFSDHDSDPDSDSSFRFRPPSLVSSHFQNPNSMDRFNTGSSDGGELISVIDRKMNEYSKNLLHAMEGLGVRLCQLEARTRKIEDSVDELKDSSVFNHGRTEIKLKDLENVLTKVQIGIRDLRDKQEISEVQIEMAKLQILRSNLKSDDNKTKAVPSPDQPVSSSSRNPNLNLASQPQCPNPNAHLPPPMPTASGQFPATIPLSQIPPLPSVQYPTPPIQLSQPTSSAAYQPYHPVQSQQPPLPYSLPGLQLAPTHFATYPQAHRLPTYNFGGIPYPPPQIYTPLSQFPQVNFGSRLSEFRPDHVQPSRHSSFHDEYARYGPPSHYTSLKPSSPRPPIPKELPRALPMASEVDVGSGSGGTGNVCDDVVQMGFRRDVVNATLRKMAKDGQSLELNAVLDKLMNGGEAKNESSRFGR